MTYDTVFVIDLASRPRPHTRITSHPNDVFMSQIVRVVTAADDGALIGHRVLIGDRCGNGAAPCDNGVATPASAWS